MENFTDGLVPLWYPLPWNEGALFAYFWVGYIAVLSVGVPINLATFTFLILNKRLQKLRSATTVKYLIGEDGLSSVICLTQCCVNFHSREILGEGTACVVEAWQVAFFITITSYSLGMIAYIVRLQVTGALHPARGGCASSGCCGPGAPSECCGSDASTPRKMSKGELGAFVFRVHLVFWFLGAAFATGSCVWPGRARLNTSGTYCIPAFEQPWPAFFFFGVAICPVVLFLLVQYAWIYFFVLQAKKRVQASFPGTGEGPPWQKHLKLARQLSSLVLAYFIFYTPFLISAFYEWATGYFAPAWLDCIGGVLVHFSSAANPILYIWTTNQARKALLEACGDFLAGRE
jgi:hypothetical protein